MSNKPNYFQIREKIEASNGWEINGIVSELSVSYSVYGGNYQELFGLLNWCTEGTEFQSYWHMQNKDKCDNLLLEVARRTHNFSSSVMSLKDNTRPVIKKLSARRDSVKKEYQNLVDTTFRNNEFSTFYQDLRNFTTHSAIPRLNAHFRLHPSVKEPSGIYLEIKRLKEWDKWTAPSKRYLSNQTSDINILGISARYNDLVRGFMDSLDKMIKDVFREELSELDALQQSLMTEYRRQGVPIDAILEKRWQDLDK